MDMGLHDLAALFGQLGLNDEPSIRQFIEVSSTCRRKFIAEAPFWNSSQKVELLQQAIADDAEWAEAADTLATLLAASAK